jgi:predicted ATP-grasp superfamily ATP-dependent carboligase
MMTASNEILILGASTRAAAFSALRAGLRPRCVDLFADADLSRHAEVVRIAPEKYPQEIEKVIKELPVAPWMYTGALENWPELLERIARSRPLRGNGRESLRRARCPRCLAPIYAENGIAAPDIRLGDEGLPTDGNWLLKPIRGAGGFGISRWRPEGGPVLAESHYLQEYVEGESVSAVYVGRQTGAVLLGVTQQLVGTKWLNGSNFRYCGSVGPVVLNDRARMTFQRIGQVLVERCSLRGLFGVDAVLRDGIPLPVEVNPRYTASVEVLEHALGFSSLGLHGACFEPGGVSPLPASNGLCTGKAILFARASFTFPTDGPWIQSLNQDLGEGGWPEHADVPHPGEPIHAGQPILSLLATGLTAEMVTAKLRSTAEEVDHFLFGPESYTVDQAFSAV